MTYGGNISTFGEDEQGELYVVDLHGTVSKIVYAPLPVDDPKVRQPDITKARYLCSHTL